VLHHQVEDCRLASAVGPNDSNPGAAVHTNLNFVKQPGLLAIIAKCYLGDVESQGSVHPMAFKFKLDDVVLLLFIKCAQFELFFHKILSLFLRLSLFLEGLELILLLLEFFVHGCLLLQVHLLKCRVVTSIVDQFFVLEVQNVCTNAVKEVGIMGYNHDSMRILF